HSQRMHDAVIELVKHAMDQGTLPRRNGVRPHINLTTTLEGLKNEVGAPPADLELSLPISTRTLQRIACDSTISRVLLADSMVIDVGRATRVNSAPRRRALGCEIAAAASPGATALPVGRRRITLCSGATAVRTTSPTRSYSAFTTTGWCMRAGGR
ncbi:MAG TPA: DUF222 domain-containing protein, partial [Candidatus Eisenbacteria bacterium]|nr:DUF222 domain-containing protein [Candidatus Eisenbacteria bacterium]